MDIGSLVAGSLIAGIFLFLWAGLTQALTPWGIRAVKSLDKEHLGALPDAMQKTTPPRGMYGVFNGQVAAFVAVRSGSYYNMPRYFALEFATQLGVGILLTLLLMLTNTITLQDQLLLVGIVALLAQVSIDFQYWNWWGFSSSYTLGFTVNRVLGLLIAAFIVGNWIV
ncbi:MAG: hypothetical protein SF123_08155 [Chloroflexota bacterium]|nr:hypothetical protein [Chloroflexota bacterium]